MTKERLRDLLREATADCHNDDEAFWSIFYTLAEGSLTFPLKARALGEPVEVVDLDGARSGVRRGIVALAELEFVDLDPVSAERLEVYQYWCGLAALYADVARARALPVAAGAGRRGPPGLYLDAGTESE